MKVTYGKGFAQVKAPVSAEVARLGMREKISRLLKIMMDTPSADVDCRDCPVTHFKAPGMYARQMFIPKGQLIIGKIHKHAHLNQITSGHVQVETEHGRMEIIGPHTFTSEPGTQRCVLAIEDTIWTTFHLNPQDLNPENEADMKKLEDEIIAKSHDDVQLIDTQKVIA